MCQTDAMNRESRRRVLVADDDSMVRLAVDRQLDALGWDAYIASSGAEAIGLIEQGLDFTVLLTDLHLPDVDGREVARAAMRLSQNLGIIFMSRSPAPPFSRRREPLLVKPFSTAALADALRAALALRDPQPDGRTE